MNLQSLLLRFITTGIYIIAFLPLFTYQYSIFPYVFPRTMAFRLIVGICLIIYIVAILYNPKLLPKKSWLFLSIAIFIAVLIASAIFGVDAYRSFFSSIERSEGIITWLYLLGFFTLLIGTIKSADAWKKLFAVVILAGWVQSLYALAQWLNLPFALKTSGERIGGSIGNPSFLAAYLIFIIFIAAYLYSLEKNTLAKTYYAGLVGLDLALLWATQTRGAILAMAFGIILFAVFTLNKKSSKKIKMSAAAILIIICASALFIYANKNSLWMQKIPTISKLASISKNEVSTKNRIIVWGTGIKCLYDRPFLGWGWENFNACFNERFDPKITKDVGSRPWYDRSHNIVIEILSTAGIIGIIFYAMIFALAFYYLWKKRNIIFAILLSVYFLQNLFVFDTLNSYIMLFIILAYIHFQKTEKEDSLPEHNAKPLAKSLKQCILAITFVAAFITSYYFIFRPVMANHLSVVAITRYKTQPGEMLSGFREAFIYSPPNEQELRFILVQYVRDQVSLRGPVQEMVPLVNFATNEMEKSIKAAPYSIQNYLILAELYLSTTNFNSKNIELAENISLKALEKSPRRYQIYSMLGRIKMSQGKFKEGIEYFTQATKLNDEFAEAYWNLGIAYILSGQAELAEESLNTARKLNFDIYAKENIEKILKAYKDSKNLSGAIQYLQDIVARFPNEPLYSDTLADLEKIYKSN